FLALPRTEILRIFRARAGEQRREFLAPKALKLCRSVAISDRRRFALRVSKTDEEIRKENSARDCATRSREATSACCRIYEQQAANSVQPVGDLPVFP